MSQLTAADGPRLGAMFIKAFTSGQVDEVWLIYNRFVSVLRQEITIEQLLPIEPPEADPDAEDAATDYLYEPDAAGLLAAVAAAPTSRPRFSGCSTTRRPPSRRPG